MAGLVVDRAGKQEDAGREPVGGVMLEFPVDLLADHHVAVRLSQTDDVLDC
jgi:hypothetical protein